MKNLATLTRLALLTVVLVTMAGYTQAPAPASTLNEARPQATVTRPLTRPNIIVILTDDLNNSVYSQIGGLQPLLDAQGTRFTSNYISDSLCCPSRTSLLRGQYVHNHGVISNRPPSGGFEKALALGVQSDTIATRLQAAGYRTALFGKYLNGYPNLVSESYIPPGWSEWYAPTTDSAYSGYNYRMNENGTILTYTTQPQDYLVDVLTYKAYSYITRTAQTGEPFFMYIAPYVPHSPATPAPRHANAFLGATAPRTASFNEADVSDKPQWVRDLPLITDTTAIDMLYRKRLQSMLGVQDMVSATLRALEQSGELDNTYIFFTSDNGFKQGQHRFEEGKQTAWEEDINVPLIVRGPGIGAGQLVNQIVGNIDLAPTFLELAGLPAPPQADGRSLVPLLFGPVTNGTPWRRQILVEYYGGMVQDQSASQDPDADYLYDVLSNLYRAPDPDLPLRGGENIPTYKALRDPYYTYVEYITGERELYYRTDPAQLNNAVNTASPYLLNYLHEQLAALAGCAGATCRTADSPVLAVDGQQAK